MKKCVARASLDNIMLPPEIECLNFSSFFIKKSPNCLRNITTMKENGTKVEIPHYPDEDEYESGFPKCQYYLEIELGEIDIFDFSKAHMLPIEPAQFPKYDRRGWVILTDNHENE